MTTIEAARETTADSQDEGVTLTAFGDDGLAAARGIIRGFLWSLPFWLLVAWWLFS